MYIKQKKIQLERRKLYSYTTYNVEYTHPHTHKYKLWAGVRCKTHTYLLQGCVTL